MTPDKASRESITIVDYGMGNLGSIQNMLKKIGVESLISADPHLISLSKKIILPGVGHFKKGMENIRAQVDLLQALNNVALGKQIPVLGICLGAQLVTSFSEEGDIEGLNWIPARTKRFNAASHLKVPHMGWKKVAITRPHPLVKDLADSSRFYFVHSYYMVPEDPSHTLLMTTYGEDFAAALQRDNIMACQFHPEKSHRFGMKILKNFSEL